MYRERTNDRAAPTSSKARSSPKTIARERARERERGGEGGRAWGGREGRGRERGRREEGRKEGREGGRDGGREAGGGRFIQEKVRCGVVTDKGRFNRIVFNKAHCNGVHPNKVSFLSLIESFQR